MQSYWYNQFLALPHKKDSNSYKRIERLYKDKTRFHGKKGSVGRIHELCDTRHETNLTATLWENFSLYDSGYWLQALVEKSGISIGGKIKECNWSYEWEYFEGNTKRLYDVIIHYRTVDDVEGVIVIECKNMGKKLSEKDTDPAYYLDVPVLKEFTGNRFLIYCLDEMVMDDVKLQVIPSDFDTGFISWQSLGVLQMELVESVTANKKQENFIKGAINFQFLSHRIFIQEKPLAYLNSEISQEEVDNNDKLIQSSYDRFKKIWRIK